MNEFISYKLFPPSCRVCGCTDHDCRQCIEATGEPCSWVEPGLCSRCYVEAQQLAESFVNFMETHESTPVTLAQLVGIPGGVRYAIGHHDKVEVVARRHPEGHWELCNFITGGRLEAEVLS